MLSNTTAKYREELDRLRQFNEAICVTIIQPLQHYNDEEQGDLADLKSTIESAKRQVELQFPEMAAEISHSLNSLADQLTFDNRDHAIGLFATKDFIYQTNFPFPLQERIIVDKGFDLSPLLYREQYDFPYLVVTLNEKAAKIYSGHLNRFQELRHLKFPSDESYAFKTFSFLPGKNNGTVVDENNVFVRGKQRFEGFLRHIDSLVGQLLETGEPLILFGSRRYTSAFLNRSSHAASVISIINDDKIRKNADFETLIWNAVRSYVAEKMMEEINNLEEKAGEGLSVDGILPVWRGITEDRGATLLIERDFSVEGRLEKTYSDKFYLHAPRRRFISIKQAISEMEETMIGKGKKIVLVENGMLRNHQHIALITEY